MEQKDVDGIANAVSRELAKLNVEKTPIEEPKENPPKIPDEIFNCPECGSPVKSRSVYCPQCGCELEWGE